MITANEPVAGTNGDLESALQEVRERFVAANPESKRRYEIACAAMPGGNTRTVLYYDPYPLTIAKGQGVTLWDVDGHSYTDFLGEYSTALYGHSHPQIEDAIKATLAEGILLGAPNTYEAELASLLCERFPSCERVRFCNSGTEANLMALTAARAHTGRSRIMVFKGAYHGGVLHFVNGENPVNAPYPVVLSEYNDLEKSVALIEQHAEELAAILVEPLLVTGGAVPADREFLKGLREAADKHGVVLIFDEVMTSRLSSGGLQQLASVTPDMSTFGKYIGGGLTFGAFGGRAPIMDQFNPRNADALAHAGTFNNNVLTMAAGVTGLRQIYTPEVAQAHNERGDQFREGLNSLIAKRQFPAQVTGIGSIMCVHFQRGEIHRADDTKATVPVARALFHLDMLAAGFYLSKLGVMTLSLPLRHEHYEGFMSAFDTFMETHASLFRY